MTEKYLVCEMSGPMPCNNSNLGPAIIEGIYKYIYIYIYRNIDGEHDPVIFSQKKAGDTCFITGGRPSARHIATIVCICVIANFLNGFIKYEEVNLFVRVYGIMLYLLGYELQF